MKKPTNGNDLNIIGKDSQGTVSFCSKGNVAIHQRENLCWRTITDQANVKAVTSALPNPIVHNAKWDMRSDRFDL